MLSAHIWNVRNGKNTHGSFTCCEFMSSDKGWLAGCVAAARDSGSLELTDEGGPVCDRN